MWISIGLYSHVWFSSNKIFQVTEITEVEWKGLIATYKSSLFIFQWHGSVTMLAWIFPAIMNVTPRLVCESPTGKKQICVSEIHWAAQCRKTSLCLCSLETVNITQLDQSAIDCHLRAEYCSLRTICANHCLLLMGNAFKKGSSCLVICL